MSQRRRIGRRQARQIIASSQDERIVRIGQLSAERAERKRNQAIDLDLEFDAYQEGIELLDAAVTDLLGNIFESRQAMAAVEPARRGRRRDGMG